MFVDFLWEKYVQAFNVNFTFPSEKNKHFLRVGNKIYTDFKNNIDTQLDNFRNADGSLDGTQLTDSWFPDISSDIFISHSHNDVDTALIFAGWLYEKQDITCFIDSCVWNYADDLLKAIDDEYCLDYSEKYYDYKKRNYSTSHVHMMLNVALSKMIYNSECLVFLNTPNSILPKNSIKLNEKSETLSPWIYSEIQMSRLVSIRTPDEHRGRIKLFSEGTESLKIHHTVDLSHLEKITFEEIKTWINKTYKNKYEALNAFYKHGNDKRGIYG